MPHVNNLLEQLFSREGNFFALSFSGTAAAKKGTLPKWAGSFVVFKSGLAGSRWGQRYEGPILKARTVPSRCSLT